MTDTASLTIRVDSSGAAKATADLSRMEKAAGGSERAAHKLGKAWGTAIGLIGSAVVVGATRAFIQQADAFANMSAKLRLVSDSSAAAARAQKQLFDLSQRNSSDLEATTELYVKLAQSSEDLRGNQELLLRTTDRVSKSLVISGADAASASAVIRQFSQAMASGALRGDEFVSVMEGAPRIARALADGLNVPVGALRKMAAEGELTADKVIKALESQGATIDREFGEMPLTVSRATQQVRNALTQLIGDTDQATGASKDLATSISKLAGVLASSETKAAFASIVGGIADIISAATSAIPKLIEFTNAVTGAINAKGMATDLRNFAGGLAQGGSAVLDYTKGYVTGNPLLRESALARGRDADARIASGFLGGGIDGTRPRYTAPTNPGASNPSYLGMPSYLGGNSGFSAVPTGLDPSQFRSTTQRPTATGDGDKKDKKPRKAALSEEARAAQQLQETYQRLIADRRENIALMGEESEEAKVRYATEHGELVKLSAVQKEQLLTLAREEDAKRAKFKADEEALELAKREREEKERGVKATDALIDDMQFELSLMSMTNAERERAIALRYADKNATEEQRAAIAGLADEMRNAREQSEFMDGFRQTATSALTDFVTGAKSAKDAIRDLFDTMAERITQMIAERWIEQAFGSMGSTGGGTQGGQVIGGLFNAIFGGGWGGIAKGRAFSGGVTAFANGGVVDGPHLFNSGGRMGLMGEAGPEAIMPLERGANGKLGVRSHGGGRTTLNQTFIVQGTPDGSTREQMARRSGSEAARGIGRTGRRF